MLSLRGAAPARRWRRPRGGMSSVLRETRFESPRCISSAQQIQPLQLLIPVPLHPILCSFATLFRKPTFRTARFKLATSWAHIQSRRTT